MTAGLKCAPEVPPSVATSIISTNACSRPMTAKSVKPRPAGLFDDRINPMNKTSRNVPTNSAA